MEMIKLAIDKVPTGIRERLAQFVDQRRFADAGGATDQDQFRGAVMDALKRGEQLRVFGFTAIELLRNLKGGGPIALGEGEIPDAAAGVPLFPTGFQISAQA